MKVIKMRPSHRPVINAMIAVYKPEHVCECGCGPNSTPLWSAGCKSVIGVEHNREWIDCIKDKLGNNVDFINKEFGKLVFSTYPEKLTPAQRQEIYDWYALLPVTVKMDLLFVDSFAGVRVYALMAMAGNAGITMYHDTEVDRYWYRYFEAKLGKLYPNGCRHYSYRPRVHGTVTGWGVAIPRQEPCTDIVFRPEHYGKISEFAVKLQEEHEKYYWQGAPLEFVQVK